jgi:hypothetical protein
MKKMVYIAAPYTHPDPVANTHDAIRVAERIIDEGFTPIIPHLCLLWHLVTPHPPEFWYAHDLEILRRCDFLLRIGGTSTGADAEVEFARREGIPVFFSINEIKEFVNAERPKD